MQKDARFIFLSFQYLMVNVWLIYAILFFTLRYQSLDTSKCLRFVDSKSLRAQQKPFDFKLNNSPIYRFGITAACLIFSARFLPHPPSSQG